MNSAMAAAASSFWHWTLLSFLVASSLCPLFSAYAAAAGLDSSTPLPAEAPSLGHHIAPGVVQAPERSHGHASPIPSPNAGEGESVPAPDTRHAPPLAPPSAPPSDHPDDSDLDSRTPEDDVISRTITWCAIRDEIEDCTKFVDQLNSAYGYGWICVQRDTAFECMQAIAKGDADLISLDAGLAYVAFMNYRMKAIMQEQYCYFSRLYKAVAIVNKKMCDRNPRLSMRDFQGLGSCHAGYLSAAGWNHPVEFLVESGLQKPPLKLSGADKGKDEAVVQSFFGKTCAPSELEGRGLCTSCGDNGTCTMDSFKYAGYAGAFRCLVDGTGDIAFVRSDTAERLSADGKHKQEWSTKSIDEFR